MSQALLLLAWLTPLFAAPWALRPGGRWWPAAAVLPALGAGLWVPPGTEVELPWLLLGTHLGLDATGRLFLLSGALIWLLAGLYRALTPEPGGRDGHFRLWFLLAMAGNLLLVLAADLLSFYLGFALMGLSAYGLVVQRRSQRARRAGRVYLGWTLVGELALFSALVLLAAGAESLRFADLAGREPPGAAVALLVFGFGIKLALPGLHFWLPLAYPAAPAAAAAVLSGPMINAGLLGWLRFLPPGTPGLQSWGEPLMLLGTVGVALGVLAGVVQRDPRAVLGYSSIAKMGLVSLLFGTALAQPETAAGITSALVLFAVHHSLVKAALFLGLGEWQRLGRQAWLLGAVGALALSLAGAPFTGGAAAKSELSAALAIAGLDLGLVLFLAAIGTVVLMARLLWLLARPGVAEEARPGIAALVWLALAVPALWLPYGSAAWSFSGGALLPLGLGLALALLAWAVSRGRPPRRWDVPPGDFLNLLPRWRPKPLPDRAPRHSGLGRLAGFRPATLAAPRELSAALAGLAWLGLFALLLGALLLPW